MIIHDVEQGSDEWHALRAGIPTASEFSKLITAKGEPSESLAEYAYQLAADAYAGEPLDRFQGNRWTERGHEMEDRARAYYENTFPDRQVSQVGFITDDGVTCGASPDSLVDADGSLEIKCLKASRHVAMIMFHKRNATITSEYMVQPQGQMMVAERQWCDSLFYHPDLPSLIVRHHRNALLITKLRAQITKVNTERDSAIATLRAL